MKEERHFWYSAQARKYWHELNNSPWQTEKEKIRSVFCRLEDGSVKEYMEDVGTQYQLPIANFGDFTYLGKGEFHHMGDVI